MKPKRVPQYGDTVYVPNTLDGTGDWIGAIVNVVRDDGTMLLGVTGHFSGAQAVLVHNYLEDWCLPEDVEMPELHVKATEL